MMRFGAILVFAACSVLSVGTAPTAAGQTGDAREECSYGNGKVREQIDGFTVVVRPVGENSCRAMVVDSLGKAIFNATDRGMALVASGDLGGIGETDVVLEESSGGAHCCWTYWFISLGKDQPGRFAKLYNEIPFGFEKSASGGTIIRTFDGAFDYFDGLCHTCTAFPSVVLELKGRRFFDVGSKFAEDYDKQILASRGRINSENLEQFKHLARLDDKTKNKFGESENPVIAPVLEVVFGYLYSGREQQAWRELNEMWPTSDVPRMKSLILKTRSEGILSKIGASSSRQNSPLHQ